MEHIDRVRAKAAVITDTTTKWVLPEDASIHTAEVTEIKITLKEIHKKKENKKWAIYTISQSSIKSIEYNKENRPLLIWTYDILVELKTKVNNSYCANIKIKENEEADKAAKQEVKLNKFVCFIIHNSTVYLVSLFFVA